MSGLNLTGTKKKVVSNLFWAVAGKVINLGGTLVLGIIVAQYLGAEQYGLMNYVISYAFLFQTLANFGLDSIEVREEAAGKVSPNLIMGTAFWLKVIFGAVCIILSVGTACIMGKDTYTISLISIYSAYIVFNSFAVIRNYFTSLVQNKYIVASEIFRTFVGIGIKLVLLALDCSLTWFVAAFAFDWVLLAGGYISAYHTKIGSLKSWKFSFSYAKYMLRESFPLLITNAAVIIYQRIDQVMIGDIIDKANVGYFSVAAKFVEVMIFIPATLAHTVSPLLVQLRQKDTQAYAQKAQQFMNLSLWLCIISSLVVSAISYWLVSYTFGDQYLPAIGILQVLSFKMACVALSNTAGVMIIIEGLQKWVFFRDVLGCLICVVLNFVLLPRYGAVAAAFVAIAANLVAGYIADGIVPAYRHIFLQQTKALLLGWRDLVNIRQIIKQ